MDIPSTGLASEFHMTVPYYPKTSPLGINKLIPAKYFFPGENGRKQTTRAPFSKWIYRLPRIFTRRNK